MKHEGDSDTNCNWCIWNDPKRLGKGTQRDGNQRMTGNHPNYSIVKISQNTRTGRTGNPGKIEIASIIALLKLARIVRRVLET